MFESIYSTKNQEQDIRNNIFHTGYEHWTAEQLKVKPIIEREIGFLLEFDWYSSD